MGQAFHKFKAATLDEAYRAMRRQLGDNAMVVRTAEVLEGGILGIGAQKMVELTASTLADASEPKPRRPSPVEKKYAAASNIGSEETVQDTVAYFHQLISDAQKRLGTARTEGASSTMRRSSVVPFKKPAWESVTGDALRREVGEIREMLQVLVAESPAAELPPEFGPHYRTLVDRGVTRKAAAELIASVVKGSDIDAMRDARVFVERLKFEIRRRTTVTGGIGLSADTCRVVALVGATGVGKTTNLAKLAALHAVRERARVALVTADTYRLAAQEQLHTYANIIGLPLNVVNEAREMAAALRAFRDYDLVLIDTAGSSQFNVKQIQELKDVLSVAQPDEVMLVLSANTQLDELRSMAANFQCVRPTSLLFTKLDETRRFGAMFSLVAERGLPLSYFSNGQNVPDDIVLAHPGTVANLVLEGWERRGRPSTKSA